MDKQSLVLTLLVTFALCSPAAPADASASPALQKRWLFVWRNVDDPKEVTRMIERFPQAAADGYNGVVFPWYIAPSKADELKQAAQKYGLDLIAVVMDGFHDRNCAEGVLVQDALFVAHAGAAALEQDNPTQLLNPDFEDSTGNHFNRWTMQDDEDLTTFADHTVVHGGQTSLRMENIGQNQYRHCRLAQPIKLQPHRQYHISFWVKTQNLTPADAEVKVLTTDAKHEICFQTFRVQSTQDWKRYDLVFNSLDHREGRLYLGSWSGKSGKLWWDDLSIEEIGLVNVLRRPGCPVTVRGEDGTIYEEGKDYEPIKDPQLNPWHAYHEAPLIKLIQPGGARPSPGAAASSGAQSAKEQNSQPAPRLAAPGDGRALSGHIREGARLRVTYYHSLVVYQDRVTCCLSEPKVFEEWREQVKRADELYHPAAYLMAHDELRVVNQCALCQSKHLTPGQLLAWNVQKSAGIIRDLRPDAEIWVWSDMFDPMHNAVDHYYAVNGPLAGSWKGLDKQIGIANWHGGLKGKNCQFFADLGLRQILAGYYDSDEDGAAIAEWLHNTRSVPGVVGAMYTTWEDKYGAMDAWAKEAWGGKGAGGY